MAFTLRDATFCSSTHLTINPRTGWTGWWWRPWTSWPGCWTCGAGTSPSPPSSRATASSPSSTPYSTSTPAGTPTPSRSDQPLGLQFLHHDKGDIFYHNDSFQLKNDKDDNTVHNSIQFTTDKKSAPGLSDTLLVSIVHTLLVGATLKLIKLRLKTPSWCLNLAYFIFWKAKKHKKVRN